MLPIIASLIIGYVFGIFQTAYFYGRMNGIDIREHGSGNAGTTNALRVLGKKAGVLVFLGDFFKCFLAVYLVKGIFGGMMQDSLFLIGVYGATGCVLGHNFPIWLGFKGGKGVASAFGFIVVMSPTLGLLALLTWLVFAFAFRYSSLSAIAAATLTPVYAYFFAGEMEAIFFSMIALLVLIRHHANIVRLVKGTESKISFKKKA